jgi:excinuclease UvrABC nuclease subunit
MVPEKAGVYIISTSQEVDHSFVVKYVGQAANLRERTNEHWSKKEPNKELKEHIAEKYIMKFNYSEIESKSDRDGMELYIRELYDPPFNHNRPAGTTAIVCTVPDVRKHI